MTIKDEILEELRKGTLRAEINRRFRSQSQKYEAMREFTARASPSLRKVLAPSSFKVLAAWRRTVSSLWFNALHSPLTSPFCFILDMFGLNRPKFPSPPLNLEQYGVVSIHC